MWIYLIIIFLIPMETHHQLSHTIMGLSVIKWVGVFAVAVALLENLKKQRSPMLAQTTQGKFFILFLLVVFTRWLLQGDLADYRPILIYISFPIFFLVTLSMVSTKERVRLVVWAIVICMLASSFYGLKQYFTVTYHGWRSAALFKDINYFALSLIMAMPFAYYLGKTVKQFYLRLFLYSSIPIFCIALISTFSRGGIVGLAGMVLLAQMISKKKIKTFVLLAILVFVAMYLAPERMWDRFENTRVEQGQNVHGAAAAATYRWNLMTAGFRMIEAHPFTGVGLGRFRALSVEYEPLLGVPLVAHNTYLEIAAEIGLPALFFYMGMVIFTYRDLWRLRRELSDDPKYALLPSVIMISLFGFLISSTFVSAQHTKLFWLLIFLTIALKRCVREDHINDKAEKNSELVGSRDVECDQGIIA